MTGRSIAELEGCATPRTLPALDGIALPHSLNKLAFRPAAEHDLARPQLERGSGVPVGMWFRLTFGLYSVILPA